MSKKIIQQRLDWYKCSSQQEEENALREITQEISLLALSRSGFFKKAGFHGGTCLRIFHGLQRFSEDLDFALFTCDPDFQINQYLDSIVKIFNTYAYEIEIIDKSNDSNVQKVLLKDDSIGKALILNHPNLSGLAKSIKIKFEVDTNPPRGAQYINSYHNFPVTFNTTTFDIPSLFAGKLHALLCREFVKGRDWYDFLWYATQKTSINYDLLQASLLQIGPWKEQELNINENWVRDEMINKIDALNWPKVSQDVIRFIKPIEQESIKLWSKDLFLDAVNKLFQK